MATFGKLTNGTSSSSSSVDKKVCSSASPSSNGVVETLHIRLWLTGADTVPARGFIYSDSSGAPNALLAVTDDLNITNTTEQEITFTFTGANRINIQSGVTYWIGAHWEDPGVDSVTWSRDSTASQRVEGSGDTFADGTSDPFGTPNYLSGPIDCYVTYTESGGGGGTTSRLTLLGVG